MIGGHQPVCNTCGKYNCLCVTTIATPPNVGSGSGKKTTWTCPDCCMNPCTCEIYKGPHPRTPPTLKETNPKESAAIMKIPFGTISAPVMAEVGVAMLEGARKYGRHNYRITGIKAQVYYDACKRHLTDWWEGEDIDKASGLSHVTKAIACLVVLRDAMIQGTMDDDRPPPSPQGWQEDLQKVVEELFKKYPECKPAFTHKDKRKI